MGQVIQETILKEVQEKYNKLTWRTEILIENTEKGIVTDKPLSLIKPIQISTKSLSNVSDTYTDTFGVPDPRVFTTTTVRVCSEGRISVFLCNFAGLGSGRTFCFGAPGCIRVVLV